MVPGKGQRRNDHAHDHGNGQVGNHRDKGHQQAHEDVEGGHLAEQAEAGPLEGLFGHHEHHADQRRQRNLLDQARPEQNERQQEQGRGNARQPVQRAIADVDHALPDHGAAAHAAEEAGQHVGCALCGAFLVGATAGVGHVVDQVEREQRFDQADRRQNQRVGEHDLQGFKRERHVRHAEDRQAAGDGTQIAHGAGVDLKPDHHQRHDHDRHQRCWNRLGELGQQINDRHGEGDQPQHQVQRHSGQPLRGAIGAGDFEMAELGNEDHNGQPVDEAQHHRVRHHADELAKLGRSEQQLQCAHQHYGGKQVFGTVLHHQRHHDHRQCARGARNHAGAAAKGRGDQRHDEGGIKAGQRRHLGHQGKGNGLRHHGQGHGQAAEQVGFDQLRGQNRQENSV